MSGLKIFLGLTAVAVVIGGYVLWPSDVDLERKVEPIEEHREALTPVLNEIAELVRFLDRVKPVEKKKTELGDIRTRLEDLDAMTEELRENEALERRVRRTGLDALEDQYYQLLRDGEDLRARLREMKRFYLELQPVLSLQGRLLPKLFAAQQEQTGVRFQQRANKLIDQAKQYRDLAQQGMTRLAHSIVEGRPVVQSALNELKAVNDNIEELLESTGAPQDSEKSDWANPPE